MKKRAPTIEEAARLFEDLLERRGIRRERFGVEEGPDEIEAPRSDESEKPSCWENAT